MTAAGASGFEPRLLHGDEPRAGERRLLLISWHFPPSREVGAQRWRRFATLAIERGWTLDVFTLDPSNLPVLDRCALEELPPGVRVYAVPERPLLLDRLVQLVLSLRRRVKGKSAASATAPVTTHRPESLARQEMRSPFRGWREASRAFLAWRDFVRCEAWSRHVEAGVDGLLGKVPYRAVITSGPPHMVHPGGARIGRARRIPLIIDLRDLWSLSPRLPESVASPWWRVLARRYERRTVRDAALIVANTEPARIAMQTLYPSASDRTIAIWNGYDDEPLEESHHGPSFIIAYAGSLYLDRDPRPLFRGAARVIREHQLTPDHLRLEFMGEIAAYGGTTLEAIAAEEGIGGFVRVHRAGTRAEAMRFMARAAMLVSLPLDRGTDVAFPAKIFEYARFDAWLVALAERGGATDLALDGTGAEVIAPDDVDAIAASVRTHYLAYVQGVRPARPQLSDRFSRRFQASALFDEIERRLPVRHTSTESPR